MLPPPPQLHSLFYLPLLADASGPDPAAPDLHAAAADWTPAAAHFVFGHAAALREAHATFLDGIAPARRRPAGQCLLAASHRGPTGRPTHLHHDHGDRFCATGPHQVVQLYLCARLRTQMITHTSAVALISAGPDPGRA